MHRSECRDSSAACNLASSWVSNSLRSFARVAPSILPDIASSYLGTKMGQLHLNLTFECEHVIYKYAPALPAKYALTQHPMNHESLSSTMNTTSDAKKNASLSFSETKSYQNLKTQCPWPIATTEPILHRTSNVGRHSRCCFPRPEKLELAGAECWTATSRKLQVGSNQPNQSPYLAAGKTNPKRWDF